MAAWGPDAAPEPGLVAQALAYGPRRRHLGLVVVATLPSPAVRIRPAAGGWMAEPVRLEQLALRV